ncbi:MAG TPA: hypothetical protein VGL33_30605 [Streptosporangiaceae bacterium]|jgi:hypothetical protein
MLTVHQPSVSDTDPQAATPYFRRCADVLKAVNAEAAVRGLGPDPLAA